MRTVRSIDELRAAVAEREVAFLVTGGQAVVVVPPRGRSRELTALALEHTPDAWRWCCYPFKLRDLEGDRFFHVLASGWLGLAREARKSGGGCA